MINPSLSSLLKKVDDRYTLCNLVGKRARMLTAGAQKLTSCNSPNVVTVAACEVDEGMVSYTIKKAPKSFRSKSVLINLGDNE